MGKNSRKSYQPVIYASCIVIGILLGKALYEKRSFNFGYNSAKSNQGKLYDILQKIDNEYIDTVDILAIEEQTINAVLDNLDPHSYYMSADEMQRENERMNGNFSGIGIEFRIIDDTITVMRPIKGGPCAEAGIHTGDKLIKVNDELFVGDSLTTKLAMSTLKGKRGTEVKLEFLRAEKPFTTKVIRGEIALESVDASMMLGSETGYIKIAHFSRTTAQEFENAYEKLLKQGMSKLIIDVRDNGGGLMDAVIEISESLLERDQMIVYTKSREGKEEHIAKRNGALCKIPLVVLINENSASASEILAGAVQDNDRGLIVGRRSFGKGLVQRPYSLMDGSNLRLTIARYYTPAGRCIQKDFTNEENEYVENNRMFSGELFSADSIPKIDSLKFETPKGNIVYGGGGIIPDIFVPLDTSHFGINNDELFEQQHIEKYFLSIVPQIQDYLSEKSLSQDYAKIDRQKLWLDFVSYLSNKDLELELPITSDNILKDFFLSKTISRMLQLKYEQNGLFFPQTQESAEVQAALSAIK